MTTAAPPKPQTIPDQTTGYAKAVLAGTIVAGRLVKLACKRHIDDLAHGHERGLKFDVKLANRAITFFSYLRLSEGEFAGKPFNLQLWQAFIVGSLFGWLGSDGFRRFRQAYIEIGKGNGKSPLAAGIGLYMLSADKEPGAQVYATAVTRDQARVSFNDAKAMVEASPALSSRCTVHDANITYIKDGSYFRPLSAEARALDGKRVHCALVDELHEHPSALVVDKMVAGTKGRRQALVIRTTNSGYDRKTVCFQEHTYSRQILEGSLTNDAWFAYVCQLDVCEAHLAEGKANPIDGCPDCDDWTDESVWLKSNPNLGVSVSWKYLREQVNLAIGSPAKQGIVQRLNFCVWTQSVTKWLPADHWLRGSNVIDRAALKGKKCYGGLDLARVHDLSAFELLFPPERAGEKYKLLSFFWCPADDIPERARRDRVPYDAWVKDGYITATDGNTTDFGIIERDIVELAKEFAVQEIAFDRAFADSLVQNLQDDHGLTMVEFGQGFMSMAAPTAEFERLVRAEQLDHDVNPVLDWMASNVVVRTDPAGSIKPDKEASPELIDGIVAAIMALGRAGKPEEPEPWHGIYIPSDDGPEDPFEKVMNKPKTRFRPDGTVVERI